MMDIPGGLDSAYPACSSASAANPVQAGAHYVIVLKSQTYVVFDANEKNVAQFRERRKANATEKVRADSLQRLRTRSMSVHKEPPSKSFSGGFSAVIASLGHS
jgi:hypothetical protein